MLTPKIQYLSPKKFVGIFEEMSLIENKTFELWNRFMPRKSEIIGLNTNLFSLQDYPKTYFTAFSPHTKFIKWALIEVLNLNQIPEGMQSFELQGGKYAVFELKGADTSIFEWIFTKGLAQNGLELDHRPHFEILGEKYQHLHPDSEEEIWIPIQ